MSLKRKKRMVIISTLSVIIVLVFVLFLWNFLDKRSSKIVSTEILELTIDESSSNLENDISNEAILPEDNSMDMHNEDGQNVDIATILTSNRVDEIEGTTYGIDVAKYQGEIDWQKVADSGLDFAMIRIGYRTQKTGIITEDSLAAYNLQQALKAGLKVGVYFFSTAVTLEEAVEEATWVANYIAPYSITYPVAYNCEGFQKEDSRQYLLSTKERSDIAIQFLTSIYESSYTPMFYAAKNELEGDYLWDTSRIEKSFKIWVAQYPDVAYETKIGRAHV